MATAASEASAPSTAFHLLAELASKRCREEQEDERTDQRRRDGQRAKPAQLLEEEARYGGEVTCTATAPSNDSDAEDEFEVFCLACVALRGKKVFIACKHNVQKVGGQKFCRRCRHNCLCTPSYQICRSCLSDGIWIPIDKLQLVDAAVAERMSKNGLRKTDPPWTQPVSKRLPNGMWHAPDDTYWVLPCAEKGAARVVLWRHATVPIANQLHYDQVWTENGHVWLQWVGGLKGGFSFKRRSSVAADEGMLPWGHSELKYDGGGALRMQMNALHSVRFARHHAALKADVRPSMFCRASSPREEVISCDAVSWQQADAARYPVEEGDLWEDTRPPRDTSSPATIAREPEPEEEIFCLVCFALTNQKKIMTCRHSRQDSGIFCGQCRHNCKCTPSYQICSTCLNAEHGVRIPADKVQRVDPVVGLRMSKNGLRKTDPPWTEPVSKRFPLDVWHDPTDKYWVLPSLVKGSFVLWQRAIVPSEHRVDAKGFSKKFADLVFVWQGGLRGGFTLKNDSSKPSLKGPDLLPAPFEGSSPALGINGIVSDRPGKRRQLVLESERARVDNRAQTKWVWNTVSLPQLNRSGTQLSR
ncbi:hypothetical protein AB1Y20_023629 [Prymnesium parvum]|uniref:RING-type domain-containing protein n=1 Tax=Prymnesium parvum TaxID=97485 RepID=A0AB34JF41_PRYPA